MTDDNADQHSKTDTPEDEGPEEQTARPHEAGDETDDGHELHEDRAGGATNLAAGGWVLSLPDATRQPIGRRTFLRAGSRAEVAAGTARTGRRGRPRGRTPGAGSRPRGGRRGRAPPWRPARPRGSYSSRGGRSGACSHWACCTRCPWRSRPRRSTWPGRAAVASISTIAPASTRPATWTAVMTGKFFPMTSR